MARPLPGPRAGAALRLDSQSPPPTSARKYRPVRRILLVNRDPRIIEWLEEPARVLDMELLLAESGDDLERALFDDEPVDLVIACASIMGPSGSYVLAKARARGVGAPFMLVMSFPGESVRVTVSEVSNDTLSSHVVDRQNFLALALSLIAVEPAAGSSAG